jgi:hypothetical protein
MEAIGRAHHSFLTDAVPEVERLIEVHVKETGEGPGRRRPDIQVVSRAAVVFTCTYWEAFCEDLAAEALRHLAEHAKDAGALPAGVKKTFKRILLEEKHELAVWSLADEGWREELRRRAHWIVSGDDWTLNTPKPVQVKQFFDEYVGIKDITRAWCWPKMSADTATRRLREFVTLRGDIAHRGSPGESVHKSKATSGLKFIKRLAAKSAECVDEYLREHTGQPLPRIEVPGS